MTERVATADELMEAVKRVIKLPDVPIVSCTISMEVGQVPLVQVEFYADVEQYGPSIEHQKFKLVPLED